MPKAPLYLFQKLLKNQVNSNMHFYEVTTPADLKELKDALAAYVQDKNI